MKRNRIVVLALPILALLPCAEAFGQAALVTDGNMEAADLSAWRTYGASVFEKSNADLHAGAQSLHMNNGGSMAGVQQTGAVMTAGRAYKLTMFYRRKSGTFGVRMGIGTSNADFEAKEMRTATSADAWTSYTRYFTMPAQINGTFRLVLLCSGEVYVDDIAITTDDLITDGDMEAAGTAAWLSYGGTYAKDNTTAFNGTQSLLITAGGVQQRFISLSAGAVYQLVVHYRRVSGTFVVRVGDRSSNADSYGAPSSPATPLSDSKSDVGAWQTYTRTIIPSVSTTDARLVITGNAYVDDISLKASEIVTDWDAEASGMDDWVSYGTCTAWEKEAADVYAGSRAIHIAGAGIQQLNLRVTPGATYDLSIWYKLNSGSLRVRLGANTSNYDFSGSDSIVRVQGAWTQFTRTFTVPADFSGSFRLIQYVGGGDVYLDNISIRPHA